MNTKRHKISVFLVFYFCAMWKADSTRKGLMENGNALTLGLPISHSSGTLGSASSATKADASQPIPKDKPYYRSIPNEHRLHFEQFIKELRVDADVTESSAEVLQILENHSNDFSLKVLFGLLNMFYVVAPTADAPSHTHKNNLEHVQKYIDELIKLISRKFLENRSASSHAFAPSSEMIPRYEERMDSRFVVIEELLLSVIITEKVGSFDITKLPATKDMTTEIKRIMREFEADKSCKITISFRPFIMETIRKYLEAESIDVFQLIQDLKPVSDYFGFIVYYYCPAHSELINKINDLVYVNGQLMKFIHDVPEFLYGNNYRDVLRGDISAVALNVKRQPRHVKFERQTVLLAKLKETTESSMAAAETLTEIYIHLRKLKYEVKLTQLEHWIANIKPGGTNFDLILFLDNVKTLKCEKYSGYTVGQEQTTSKELTDKIGKEPVIYSRQKVSVFFSHIQSLKECDQQKIDESIQTLFDDSIWSDLTTVDKLNIAPGLESKDTVRELRAKIQDELNVYQAFKKPEMGDIYKGRLQQIDDLMQAYGISINK